LKWGEPVRKHSEEAQAHKRMLQRGLDRRLIVPMLNQNLVFWSGLGFLAYGYEENAQTGFELMKSKMELDPLLSKIELICALLYRNRKQIAISPRKELERWCGLKTSASTICGISLHRNLEVTNALIHGDLHLRNILIRDKLPTLIDFARSDYGPVAMDLAKIAIDILVFFYPEQIAPGMLKFDSESETCLNTLMKVFDEYIPANDDKDLFRLSILAYAMKYREYPDVGVTAKEALRLLVADSGLI
jgi:hypothetical protein